MQADRRTGAADNVPDQRPQEVFGLLHTYHWLQVTVFGCIFVMTFSDDLLCCAAIKASIADAAFKNVGSIELQWVCFMSQAYYHRFCILCVVRLIEKLDFPDSKFSLYFLGYHEAKDIPEDRKERVRNFAG